MDHARGPLSPQPWGHEDPSQHHRGVNYTTMQILHHDGDFQPDLAESLIWISRLEKLFTLHTAWSRSKKKPTRARVSPSIILPIGSGTVSVIEPAQNKVRENVLG